MDVATGVFLFAYGVGSVLVAYWAMKFAAHRREWREKAARIKAEREKNARAKSAGAA